MSGRIWAWSALFLLATGLDLVVDWVERIKAPSTSYHGINPTSFDYTLSFIALVATVGLVTEAINGWRTRVRKPVVTRLHR